ncbi:hypothetical protein ACGFI4_06605 [Micromonospora carbonacea]|uniref:hypothetical protein n=1 Tax=Micromonospora carbonacea TaxID=47853 RepID=UPI003722B18E
MMSTSSALSQYAHGGAALGSRLAYASSTMPSARSAWLASPARACAHATRSSSSARPVASADCRPPAYADLASVTANRRSPVPASR